MTDVTGPSAGSRIIGSVYKLKQNIVKSKTKYVTISLFLGNDDRYQKLFAKHKIEIFVRNSMEI